MLVDRLIARAAERSPESEALLCGGRRLTYAQLNDAVARVAGGLRALGVRRGDRVAINLENSVEAVLSIFGTLRAGAVFVPINPTTKAEKLAYLLRDSEAAVLVSDRKLEPLLADARALVPGPLEIVLTGNGTGDHNAAPRLAHTAFADLAAAAPSAGQAIDLDLAALIYTSGSTGHSKGVMMTHANILAATSSINAYLRNQQDDTILDVLPLSFDYGLYQLFLAFQAGARVALEKSFAFPTVMLELMARERVTALPIVPMVAALLLKHELAGYDLASLRYITNTGAVLPPVHIAALRERLPHVRIFSMYGLTECKRVSYLDPSEIDRRPASVGRAMRNCETFLITDDGKRVETGVGELVVRGANVMQGYWRAPEATDRVLKPGVLPGEKLLYTGDRFFIDEDGYMFFQGRTDDVIKCRGQKVSPREVENVVYGLPGVCEAVVVGVPDEIAGQVVKAFVTLHAGASLTEQDILLHCSQHLEDFMIPRSVEIVPALPHTTSGKLVRRDLGEPVGQLSH